MPFHFRHRVLFEHGYRVPASAFVWNGSLGARGSDGHWSVVSRKNPREQSILRLPYSRLPGGDYRLRIFGEGSASEDLILRIGEERVNTEKTEIEDGQQVWTFKFYLPRRTRLDWEVLLPGRNKVVLDSVELKRVGLTIERNEGYNTFTFSQKRAIKTS